MKKAFISMVLLLSGIAVNGQTVKQLFKEFKDKPNVESVHLGKLVMRLAGIGANDMSFGDGSVRIGKNSHVSSLRVLTLDGSNREAMDSFSARISGVDFAAEGYDLLLKANEGNEKVKIYVKPKKNYITELLVLAEEPGEAVMVQVAGKMKVKDLMDND